MSLLLKHPFNKLTISSVRRELADSSVPSVNRASSNSFKSLQINIKLLGRNSNHFFIGICSYLLQCQNPEVGMQFWITKKSKRCWALPTMTEYLETVRNSFRHHFQVYRPRENRATNFLSHWTHLKYQ